MQLNIKLPVFVLIRHLISVSQGLIRLHQRQAIFCQSPVVQGEVLGCDQKIFIHGETLLRMRVQAPTYDAFHNGRAQTLPGEGIVQQQELCRASGLENGQPLGHLQQCFLLCGGDCQRGTAVYRLSEQGSDTVLPGQADQAAPLLIGNRLCPIH